MSLSLNTLISSTNPVADSTWALRDLFVLNYIPSKPNLDENKTGMWQELQKTAAYKILGNHEIFYEITSSLGFLS